MSGLAARVARRGERGRTPEGSLDRRLTALAEAAELARGRLDGAAVADAEAVVGRAGQRLGLGVESTVIALAGPTGAGKSTLFNALAGAELSTPGHRRPTTSTASAAVWGGVDDALLDWLEVPRRHRMGDELDGLVLLDLPDFDSVVREHRLEVDRVVALADLMVWVVDPQKYADASLHEHYLRPLAGHREAMLVVLNQADRLEPADRASASPTSARCWSATGCRACPCSRVSARTHEGLGALRSVVAERVALREAAATRLAADVTAAAARLDTGCGGNREGSIGRADRAALVAALEQAAGVPAVVRAVDRAHRRRGALAAGWPYGRWLLRLRPDPLRRLRLPDRVDPGAGPADRASLPAATRSSAPRWPLVPRAVAARAGEGLPEPWPGLLRGAALREEERMPDRLEAAVAGTDLGLRRPALVARRRPAPDRGGRRRPRRRALARRPRRARIPAAGRHRAHAGRGGLRAAHAPAPRRDRRRAARSPSWRASPTGWVRAGARGRRHARCGNAWRRWPTSTCSPRWRPSSRRAPACAPPWPPPAAREPPAPHC